MRAVWLALFACAACKGEDNKEPVRPAPEKAAEPEQQAPPPPPATAPAPAKPLSPPAPAPAATPPLAPEGAHADYPTAAAAGTDKIFLLEEPDRGPKAPASFQRPRDIVWTRSQFCSTYNLSFACTPGAGDWYVGRGKGVTVVERRRGKFVDEASVYLMNADGTRAQTLTIDEYDHVDEALLFSRAGHYSGRTRDGGNALQGCGGVSFVEDKKTRTDTRTCLQWSGEPMRDKEGVASWRYKHDARGFEIEEAALGLDGKPVDDTSGVHRSVYTLDPSGRAVLTQRFSKSGTRVANTSGCAGRRTAFSKSGYVERQTCLDTSDKPTGDLDGISARAFSYDANGCRVSERYFDVRDARATDLKGVHGRDYVPNEYCLATSETCVGTDDKPRACGPERSANAVVAYDTAGNMISRKFFDAAAKPRVDAIFGVHELRYRYDSAGGMTESRCFDAAGAAVECGSTGYHGNRLERDDAGRIVAVTFIDSAGNPATNLGAAKRTYRYDNYDHDSETRFLNDKGVSIDMAGAMVRRNLYDASHRLFGVLMLDAAGFPADYRACYQGATCPKSPWHAARINRRGDGKALTNQFFSAAGRLIATVDCRDSQCFD